MRCAGSYVIIGVTPSPHFELTEFPFSFSMLSWFYFLEDIPETITLFISMTFIFLFFCRWFKIQGAKEYSVKTYLLDGEGWLGGK